MLSDEEKKAIDNMKSLLLYSKEHEYFSPFQEQEIDDMNIVLNIIEKQSKEIEELKANKGYHLGFIDGGIAKRYEYEDKIKAKIEPRLKELDENMKKEWKEYGNSREYQDMEEEWNFLQSLLEKE